MITEIDTTDAPAWLELRSLLAAAQYTTDTVRSVLGLAEPAETVLGNTGRYSLIYLNRLRKIDTPGSVLAQLFLFQARVPGAGLSRLDRRLVALLRQFGLMEPAADDAGLIRGTVSITEYAGRYFVSDALFENLGSDFVVHDTTGLCMPPHASSLELLAGLRKPDGAQSFLDVGCGTGCQSIVFAAGYPRITGFDPHPRVVMFARANSLLNGVSGRYLADRWETFQDEDPYDHIAFNSNSSDSGFELVNSRIDGLLSPLGTLQVWMSCEVTREDGDVRGLLKRKLTGCSGLRVNVAATADSPFALSPENVRDKVLPRNTLLVAQPAERDGYLRGLAERDVVEVVSATLSISRR